MRPERRQNFEPELSMRSIRRGSIALAPALLFLFAALPPGQSKAETPAVDAASIATVVAKVSPAVVRIVSVRPPKPEQEETQPEVKVADAKAKAAASDKTTMAIGSGFVIDPSGFIATNKHVIEEATSVFVVTAEGVRYQATIVGMPAKADMALLRIHAGHDLPSVQYGDSDKMRVGDMVIAIGSPFGFDTSVTAGIVSAVNRDIMESPFDDYIQTDAAINHGNSGGPLFNLAGEVIGMNSVIFAPGTGSIGLGFALPSNDLRFVFDRLIQTGRVTAGMLPIHTQQVSWMLGKALAAPTLEGAVVSSVHDANDAMLHGNVKPGDVILSFNGQKIRDPRDLARKAAWAPIGSTATLELDRGGERRTVSVTIQAWPESQRNLTVGNSQQKLGLQMVSTRDQNGASIVTVASVDPNGTAADSGIQKDDVIVEVQRTPVSGPDQALAIFQAQSSTKHPFAAVLVERDKKRTWMPIAIPPE
jgi:serine protease Do